MTRDNPKYGLVRDARAAMIGRDEEMALLDAALAAVEEKGETRVVTIVGPGGLGKSRLVQEFVVRHRAGDSLLPRVYRGSARENDGAFALFGRLLRSRFGLVESMDREEAKAIVREQVAQVQGDRKIGDVVYFLGQFLDLPFEESPLTRAVKDDAQESSTLRRAVMKAFIEADAAHSPLCLVFEDLQFAHHDALVLLRYLVEYLAAPVLLLHTARPELLVRHEEWARAGEARHQVVELTTLRDGDAAAMVEALLAPCRETAGRVPQELVDAALGFAGGNPALLEQMVRIYHDKGVLEEVTVLTDEPAWEVHLERLETARLPLTIEDAVDARLAALEPHERRLLEQAAAMGSVFWTAGLVVLSRIAKDAPDLWEDVPGAAGDDGAEPAAGDLADEARVQALLDELVERDYLLQLPDSSFVGTSEYCFKHNKERETVQKRTNGAQARRYHAVLADWMEHLEATRASDETIAMLAEHRERGGDAVRAGLAYVEAGDSARVRYASGKASEYYEKGLELLGDAYAARRIDALHNHGDVLLLQGRVDDALAAFREMQTLAWRLDHKSKGGAAHNRIGRLYRDTGALDEASRHLDAAMRLFSACGDERGVASSLDDAGKLLWLKGEYEQALPPLRLGLLKRRRLGDRRSIALSLNNLGLVHVDSGNFRQALDYFEQSLAIRREIGDLVGVVTTLNNLGTVAQDQRDFDRALALFKEALDVAKQVGDRNRIALVLVNIGETHERAGQPDQAIEVLRQAEEQFDELGDKLGLAEALRALGKAHLLQGDLVKAKDAISRAVDLFAAVRSKVHLGIALRTLGEITAAGGWGPAHTKSAREYFARSVAIFEQTGNDVELARTRKAYARFLQTDPEFQKDPVAQAEAIAMTVGADETFARLRIVEDAHPPIRRAAPRDPDEDEGP
jgi:tetratricopeptide (TPR) repeat protein